MIKNMALEFLITFGTGKHQIVDERLLRQVPWKIPVGIYLNDPVYDKIVTGHIKTSQNDSSIVGVSFQLHKEELPGFVEIISEFSIKLYRGKDDTVDIDRSAMFYSSKLSEQIKVHLDINIPHNLLRSSSDMKASN